MSVSTITYQSPPEALQTMLALIRIALKATGHNPNPVEIKLELAGLNQDYLMQMREDIEKLIINNNVIKD